MEKKKKKVELPSLEQLGEEVNVQNNNNNNNNSLREYSKVNGRPQTRDPKISESTKMGKCQRKGFLGDLKKQKTIGKS